MCSFHIYERIISIFCGNCEKLPVSKDEVMYTMDQQPVSEKGQRVNTLGFAGSKVSVTTGQHFYGSTVEVTFQVWMASGATLGLHLYNDWIWPMVQFSDSLFLCCVTLLTFSEAKVKVISGFLLPPCWVRPFGFCNCRLACALKCTTW